MFYRFMNLAERFINSLDGLVAMPAKLAGRGSKQPSGVAQQGLSPTHVFPCLVAFLSGR